MLVHNVVQQLIQKQSGLANVATTSIKMSKSFCKIWTNIWAKSWHTNNGFTVVYLIHNKAIIQPCVSFIRDKIFSLEFSTKALNLWRNQINHKADYTNRHEILSPPSILLWGSYIVPAEYGKIYTFEAIGKMLKKFILECIGVEKC